MDKRAFPDVLKMLRHGSGQSQMKLALSARVSQRHLSFLESGRAKPGREVLVRLAKALRLPPAAANELLASAGFSGIFPDRAWTSAQMAPIRAAANHILSAHLPYPAVLIDIAGDIIDSNVAFDAVLSLLGDPEVIWKRTHGDQPKNLLRLTLHPDGPASVLTNFPEVARATLERAAAERFQSDRLRTLLEEIVSWPNVEQDWLVPQWAPPHAPIIEERYRIADQSLGIFAITTTLGAPMDLAAGSLRIESYYPIDEKSDLILQETFASRQTLSG